VLYDYNADLHGIGNRSLLKYYVTSICDLTSISRIQRPLKACFRLLYDDDDDDDDDELLADSVDNTLSGKLFHIGTI